MVDGWRLIVASGPALDTERQWQSWLRSQPVPPHQDDVRIEIGKGPSSDWNEYWVRCELPWPTADRVAIVNGTTFDPQNRKNNTVLGRCDDPARLEVLIDALATTNGERPSLMTPGSPTIAFLRGRSQLVTTVTVVAGKWIRSPLWMGDAPLRSRGALNTWLSHVIEPRSANDRPAG